MPDSSWPALEHAVLSPPVRATMSKIQDALHLSILILILILFDSSNASLHLVNSLHPVIHHQFIYLSSLLLPSSPYLDSIPPIPFSPSPPGRCPCSTIPLSCSPPHLLYPSPSLLSLLSFGPLIPSINAFAFLHFPCTLYFLVYSSLLRSMLCYSILLYSYPAIRMDPCGCPDVIRLVWEP